MKTRNFDQYLEKEINSNSKYKAEFDNAEQAINIASQIYNLRKSKRLTQTQFARMVGISQPNIARIESGDYKSYSLRTLNKAAQVLNSDVEIKITPYPKTKTIMKVLTFKYKHTFNFFPEVVSHSGTSASEEFKVESKLPNFYAANLSI